MQFDTRQRNNEAYGLPVHQRKDVVLLKENTNSPFHVRVSASILFQFLISSGQIQEKIEP